MNIDHDPYSKVRLRKKKIGGTYLDQEAGTRFCIKTRVDHRGSLVMETRDAGPLTII